MKLAAIDIGSNAVRLLINDVYQQKEKVIFKKDVLVRVPLRLGEQAFLDGQLYPNKINQLKKTMSAFKNLIEVYDVKKYRACATSAMREATNGAEVANLIKKEAGIDIEIIDGITESKIIFSSYAETLKSHSDKTFMNIDVGGGSTELVIFDKGEFIDSHSFDIGTIRLLNEQVEDSHWQEMKNWIEERKGKYKEIIGLGSGGNINKIKKIYLGSTDSPITAFNLQSMRDHLSSFTLRQRINELGLKPDRADVIVPASNIYCKVVGWAEIKKIFVPKIGLADGIIKLLFREME